MENNSLICIIVGAVLAGFFQFCITFWQHCEKIKSLKVGFASEIEIILKAVVFWKIDAVLQIYIDCLSRHQQIPAYMPKTFNKGVAFKFYNDMSSDIGYLKQDIVRDIVLFYGNVNAVLQDIENLHSLKNTNIPALEIVRKDRELFNQAIRIGNELLYKLKKLKVVIICLFLQINQIKLFLQC